MFGGNATGLAAFTDLLVSALVLPVGEGCCQHSFPPSRFSPVCTPAPALQHGDCSEGEFVTLRVH